MVTAVAKPQAVAFLTLSLAACGVWASRSAHDATVAATHAASSHSQVFAPAQLGPWSGKSIEIDQRVFEILETHDVSTMEYHLSSGALPVWLAQVAGFGNRTAFHPPEICYVGSHFEVLERGPISLEVHGQPRQFMRLVIAQGEQRFEAWYWFTANGRVTPNYYQQQVWLMMDAMRGKPMSGSLVRVSTQLDDPARAKARLIEFVNEYESALAHRNG